jgi:hypothetical protein
MLPMILHSINEQLTLLDGIGWRSCREVKVFGLRMSAVGVVIVAYCLKMEVDAMSSPKTTATPFLNRLWEKTKARIIDFTPQR